MGEMVESAVVQEIVSGAFSFMSNSHEESASQSHLLERLKMAHLELKFSLERSKNMPITEVSLLQRRMVIKHAFEESRGVLDKHTVLRVNLDDEGAEEGLPLSPSLPKRIMHAVKPFFSTGNDSISGSCVRRFEWFAEKADKFVRDVESGCSLARYRFSSPLMTQLLEGKDVLHTMANESLTRTFSISSSYLEDYGVVAFLTFDFKDADTPMKSFSLHLMLRLSESTDIVGIATKCLQSLEPQFKPAADVASGELAQIFTQAGFTVREPPLPGFWFNRTATFCRVYRGEPLCCIGNGFQHSAKNILPSELTERFPEQVSLLRLECFVSAAEYDLKSSTIETNRHAIRAWPILQLSVMLMPHASWQTENDKVRTYVNLSKMAEFVLVQAVDCFKLEPERTEYRRDWWSAHGVAWFTVSKPTTKIGCAAKVGDGSRTRRVSKRRR